VRLTGLLTTTLEMTESSAATVEFCWVWPRTMFSLTAVAVSGSPNHEPPRQLEHHLHEVRASA
jgi:hypothetical protein